MLVSSIYMQNSITCKCVNVGEGSSVMLNLRDLSPATKGKGGKYVDEQRRSPYSLLSRELGKDHLLLSTPAH